MIDLIIPIFNRPEYAKACLKTLSETNHGEEIRPIIVNNGSRVATTKVISEYAPLLNAEVITIEKNISFSNGVNKGIEKVKTDIFGILHSDTLVCSGWAKEMLGGFLDEDVAVVIPKTNYANEDGACLPFKREQFLAIKPPNKDQVLLDDILSVRDKTYPEGIPVFLDSLSNVEPRYSYFPDVSTFCMFVRKSVVDKYPLFNEDFMPKGYEDKFWWKPMEKDGYCCQIANRAWVHHFGNITSDGPGFSFHEMMKVNEEKFKNKCLEMYYGR